MIKDDLYKYRFMISDFYHLDPFAFNDRYISNLSYDEVQSLIFDIERVLYNSYFSNEYKTFEIRRKLKILSNLRSYLKNYDRYCHVF